MIRKHSGKVTGGRFAGEVQAPRQEREERDVFGEVQARLHKRDRDLATGLRHRGISVEKADLLKTTEQPKGVSGGHVGSPRSEFISFVTSQMVPQLQQAGDFERGDIEMLGHGHLLAIAFTKCGIAGYCAARRR